MARRVHARRLRTSEEDIKPFINTSGERPEPGEPIAYRRYAVPIDLAKRP